MKNPIAFSLCLLAVVLLSCSNNNSLREKEYSEYQLLTDEIMEELLPYFPYSEKNTIFVFENSVTGKVDTFHIEKDKDGSLVQQEVCISEYEPYSPGDYEGLFFNVHFSSRFANAEMEILQSVNVRNRDQLSKDSTGTVEWWGEIQSREKTRIEEKYRKSDYSNLNRVAAILKDTLVVQSEPMKDGGYMLLVHKKGLTEFSLDGQEIWRLVESE